MAADLAEQFGPVPETSTVKLVKPQALGTPELRRVYAIWESCRATRALPGRSDMVPGALGKYLRLVSLLRVIPERDDYEFRIIGDAHVQAYDAYHQGQRMRDVVAEAPGYGSALKSTLDNVVRTRKARAWSGLVGRDAGIARFAWYESLFLPLGETGATVDHVLSAAVYLPRSGAWT